jgi:hypothetical protein
MARRYAKPKGAITPKNAPSDPEAQAAMEGRMSLTVDLVSTLPLLGTDIRLGTMLGMLGVAFVLASVAVKRMTTLRTLSLAGSVCFIVYGFLEWQFPSIALNVVLIPLNAVRLWEITRLSKEIERATEDAPVGEWLLPHAQRRAFKAGEVLFRKGDPADRLVYVARGTQARRNRAPDRPWRADRGNRAVFAGPQTHTDGRMRDRR